MAEIVEIVKMTYFDIKYKEKYCKDINALDEMGKITKVHGGAVSRSERFFPIEENVEEKIKQFSYEKGAIARYAASLLDDGDFAFIDAGTTTEKMIDYLPLSLTRLLLLHLQNWKIARLLQTSYRIANI